VEILLFNMSFFPIGDMCLSCEYIARESCAMVPRWRIFGRYVLRTVRHWCRSVSGSELSVQRINPSTLVHEVIQSVLNSIY